MSFFTDQERKIYESPLGKKYDPVDLYHRLEAASAGKLNAILEQWWGDEVGNGAAALELTRVGRVAFGFKPFDQPDGVMDADVLDTVYHFLSFREGKG